MNMIINGKSYEDYIKEQKEKNNVITIHHGKSREKFGVSYYNGSTTVICGDRDVRYEDADISIEIDNKEYRLKGRTIERKDGIWFVDGKKANLPNQKQENGVANSDSVVDVVNEVVDHCENIYGSYNIIGKNKIQTFFHGTETTEGSRTVIKDGSVNIKRGGKTYTITGKNIEKINGQWYADGKAVEWDTIGGEYEDNNVVNIEINGTVQNLTTTSGDVTVNGSVQSVRTTSGDVKCETATNVRTMSGNVHSKHIEGNVSTMSGNIYE